jgi:hypothetical protein
MKWKLASAKYRKDIARAVIAASPALLSEADGRPNNADIRRALLRYGFNTKQRVYPPDDVAEILAWATRNSIPMSALAEPAVARRILDQASGRLDGKSAAASTARRNRTILANAMDYAIELGLIDSNPIRALKWTQRRQSASGARPARRGARAAAKRPDARRFSSRSCTTRGCAPRKRSAFARRTLSYRPGSGRARWLPLRLLPPAPRSRRIWWSQHAPEPRSRCWRSRPAAGWRSPSW